MPRAMRIAVGGILHETSTFLPFLTTLAHFEQGFGLFRGSAVRERFAGANMCIGGFFDAAETEGFEAVPLLWGFAYPSGLIRRQDYETLKQEFLHCLRAADAAAMLDGVLLDLHGAMVVEGIEDGDGDMVASVRDVVGPDRPVVVTYDLHGNHSVRRMQLANASIGYDTYPHVDMVERGREAGRSRSSYTSHTLSMVAGPPSAMLAAGADVLRGGPLPGPPGAEAGRL